MCYRFLALGGPECQQQAYASGVDERQGRAARFRAGLFQASGATVCGAGFFLRKHSYPAKQDLPSNVSGVLLATLRRPTIQTASVRVHYGIPGVAVSAPDPVAAVDAILSVGDAELDYGRAKLAFDQLIDSSHFVADVMGQIDQMTDAVRQLAGPSATPDVRIAALRRFMYIDGPWNDHRAFAYDQTDPLGQQGNRIWIFVVDAILKVSPL